MPPLRERKDDIPRLVKYFLHKLTAGESEQPKSIASSAMRALERYHWPGNVRELESLLRRVCVVAQGDVVLQKDLPPEITGESAAAGPVVSAQSTPDGSSTSDLSALARQLFQWA